MPEVSQAETISSKQTQQISPRKLRPKGGGPAEHDVDDTWVSLVNDEEQMRQYVPLWEQLAQTAAEPNVFFEHWMLLPAVRLLRENADVSIAFVFEQTSHSSKRLIGVMPVERIGWGHHLPLPTLKIWKHRHCYLCTPLVARNAVKEFWSAIFDGLDQDASLLEMSGIGMDGPVFRQLVDCCSHKDTPVQLEGMYARALMHTAPSVKEYAARTPHLHSHRRNYARRQRRLAELGSIELYQLAADEDAGPRIDAYIEMEAAGWKGRGGTAMACALVDAEYLMEIGLAAHAREALMLLELRLDGEPIASQINLHAGNGVFGLKTTYNEAHSNHSPGMLLAIGAMDLLHGRPDVEWFDCCSAKGNDAMKCLFGELRTIGTALCSSKRTISRLLASAIPLGRQLHKSCVGLLGH